jgi:hypothetical protein
VTATTLTRHHRIRIAGDDDRDRIARIASLDSSHPIEGPALVGEIDGVAVAVVSLTDGRAVANPFRPTAGLVEVMRVRARAMGAADAHRSRARRVRDALRRPRSVYAGI